MMFRMLSLIGLIAYLVLGMIAIKNHSQLQVGKLLKLALFLIYLFVLALMIYITLFIWIFGYNT